MRPQDFQQGYLTDAQRLRRAFEQEVATWGGTGETSEHCALFLDANS